MSDNIVLPYNVAVYGSLRKGFGNHARLKNATYKGTFKTEPKFTMYSMGAFPAVTPKGDTAIKIEVYEVNDMETAIGLDVLEGYNGEKDVDSNLYNKMKISTEGGDAELYIINERYINDQLSVIESGDWSL